MNWRSDSAFRAGAELAWPDLVRLATHWSKIKGQTEADRTLQERFEGWMLLRRLASMRMACEAAERELRGSRP